MKKKSLITMVLSLALVAIIGTGATLAYLSANSNKVTNTFTVGSGYDDEKNGLYVDEHEVDGNGLVTEKFTREGNKYDEILPGDTLSKDPTVHFNQGPDSYIFVNVTGMSEEKVTGTENALFTYLESKLGQGFDDKGAWEKADGKPTINGVYVYKVNDSYKVAAGTDLAPLFTGVELNKNVTEVQFNTLKSTAKGISAITIQAAAVQFDNVNDKAEAFTLVKDLFK